LVRGRTARRIPERALAGTKVGARGCHVRHLSRSGGPPGDMHAWLIAQILQFSKLERFMSVTSRQVTANVRLWLHVESLQVIVSCKI
jgi:hypothetical protein